MKLLKQAMAVLGTVVVIAGIAALVTPKTAHAIVATAVNVMNTPSVNVANTPVPVTGSVNVTGLPTPVQVFGAVSLNNTPNVNVANAKFDPVQTVAADNPALQSYSAETSNRAGGLCFSSITVPSNTFAGAAVTSVVIEEVSAEVAFSGMPPTFLRVVIGGSFPNGMSPSGAEFFLPFNIGSANTTDIALGQQTRLYVPPGGTINLNVGELGVTANVCAYSVFGYLVTN